MYDVYNIYNTEKNANACIITSLLKDQVTVNSERFNLASLSSELQYIYTEKASVKKAKCFTQ